MKHSEYLNLRNNPKHVNGILEGKLDTYYMANIRLNPTNSENLDIEISGSSVWASTSNVLTSNNFSAINDFTGGTGSGVSDYLYVNQFSLNLEAGTPIKGIEITVERKGVGEVNDYYVGLVYPDGEGIAVTSPGKQLIGTWPITNNTATYGAADDTFNRTWTVDEVNHNDFGFVITVEGNAANLDAALIDHISLMVYYTGAMNIDTSGGAGCGGSAIVSCSISEATTGGGSGAGSHQVIHNIKSDGGLNGTGVAICSFYYDLLSNVSVSVGGKADASLIFYPTRRSYGGFHAQSIQLKMLTINNITATGGIVAGGLAQTNYIDEEGFGGGVINGVAETNFFDDVDGDGGALGSGEAAIFGVETRFPIGGIVAGGLADTDLVFIDPATGGTVVNGDGADSFVYTLETSGGMLAGGRAIFTYIEEGDGGVTANGDGLELFTYTLEALGGVIVNGAADFSLIYPTEEGAGGVVAGGQITTSITPFHEGGARVGGAIDKEEVIFNPIFNGEAAVVNGTGKVNFFDYEDGAGGCVVSPTARIEYIRFFTTVKNKNTALALKSDNIIKTAFFENLQGEQIVQRFPAFGVVPAPDPEDVEGIRFDPAAVWCDFDEPPCTDDGAFLTDLVQSNQGEENIPPKNRKDQPRDRTIARLS